MIIAIAAVGVMAFISLAPSAAGPAPDPATYLSPIAVAASSDSRTFIVAEETGNRIDFVDIATGSIRRHWLVSGAATGVATAPSGDVAYATVDGAGGTFWTLDGQTAMPIGAAIHVGHAPNSPVVSPDGHTAYVCNRFDNDVSVIDLAAHRETGRIAVGREPVAEALTPDGQTVLVANLLPAGPDGGQVVSAEVTLIDTHAAKVSARLLLPDGSYNARGVCVSPDGRYAYVTHILGHYKMPATRVDHGWMNVNALTIVSLAERKIAGTVLLDDIDRGAANPWGAACTGDGRFLCVAHAGTNEVSVIDRQALHTKLAADANAIFDLSFMKGIRRRIALSGTGPRAVCAVDGRFWVASYFSDRLVAIDADPSRPGPRVPLAIELAPQSSLTAERKGEILFNDARLCFQEWQSCASCHADGRSDGLTWDLMNDGLGHPLKTRSLLNVLKTGPFPILGSPVTGQDAVRAGMRNILFQVPRESDAQAIDSYLASLKPVTGASLSGGKTSGDVSAGRKVFETSDCVSCHDRPYYNDSSAHDVGTGHAYYPPSLIEAWRNAPYLHDGSAVTLVEAIKRHQPKAFRQMTDKDKSDLIAFLNSL